ncbi:hypothetical protein HW555_001311 [Spodoptera exigua]|uniref:Lipase domain-containing protein n=1 Tax=Spodoptera exigua TaxID=7107 RepID=A0A835GUE7_SPOEX|nr:hypothetical protein HW555_001311 [Spodoptera exigua]
MRLYSFYLFLCICLNGITCINGGFKGWLLNLFLKCPVSRNQSLDVSQISVYFYDFQRDRSKSFPINKAAKGILSFDKLDKHKKFYMFVSGFATYINHTNANLVRKTFENVPNSYLILIDHSAYTNDADGPKKSYERSVQYVYSIGLKLAQMLAELNQGGINAKRFHAIGHSLGSQMLGYVGTKFMNATGNKIARITALDPAGPCFTKSFREEQIRAGVADYVEVYHCDDGGLGTSNVLGDTDFYMNTGSAQPQCSFPSTNKCSHKACVSMWMASVDHRFLARQCDKFKSFKQWKCSNNITTTAGFWNPGTAKGIYYFSTQGYKLDVL